MKKLGRPKKQTPVLVAKGVRLEPENWELIDKIATSKNVSTCTLLRIVLTDYVEKVKEENPEEIKELLKV